MDSSSCIHYSRCSRKPPRSVHGMLSRKNVCRAGSSAQCWSHGHACGIWSENSSRRSCLTWSKLSRLLIVCHRLTVLALAFWLSRQVSVVFFSCVDSMLMAPAPCSSDVSRCAPVALRLFALLATAPLPTVLADARPSALLALAPLPIVLADAPPSALLALAP